MSESKKETKQGVSLIQNLLILFIVLKLTDNIEWSWWWVLSPLWIPFSILFVITFLTVLYTQITRK